ncbi:MAG: hypothetical protein RR846_02335 [Oscillospiraceae bacterium]
MDLQNCAEIARFIMSVIAPILHDLKTERWWYGIKRDRCAV